MRNIPVILVGGLGKRLWPLSNKKTPKQFLKFNSHYSLFQKTMLRIEKLKLSKPIIVCNIRDKTIIDKELKKISLSANIILEPYSKNTAPAIISAALLCDSSDNLIIFPCDHLIGNDRKFVKTVSKAIKVCQDKNFVTLGVKPSFPNTEFGYIEIESANKKFFKVKKYTEKPSLKIAKNYILSGNYFWNCGVFIGKSQLFIEEIKKYNLDIFSKCKNAVKNANKKGKYLYLDDHPYSKCQNVSIDIAVMEKTKSINMIVLDTTWNDLGSWNSVWDISKKDENNNYAPNNVITDSTKNSYFRVNKKIVVSIGNENLIVVESDDSLLIVNKDQLHKMKNIDILLK